MYCSGRGAVVEPLGPGDLTMSFAWSPVLLSLLAVPLLLGAYIVIDRRRRRRTVVYSSVALLRAARPVRSAWRRHVPFALVLAALAALGLRARDRR